MNGHRKKSNLSFAQILMGTIGALVLSALVLWVGHEVPLCQIHRKIMTYVQENAQNIELRDPDTYQEFCYTSSGLQDGGVEYGYYYSPDDNHFLQEELYRKGYRTNGIPDDPTDWFYSERICENWFYYEIHDG